jgi:hypothetical protein
VAIVAASAATDFAAATWKVAALPVSPGPPSGSTESPPSPGGQNVLIRQMVDDFCGYFTPGGQVLYVGDADAKWAFFEQAALADLGVIVDQHGKMPDLVVYLPDKNWSS